MSNPYGADVTGAIYDGPTACVVKFVKIDTTGGAPQVLPAVAGKKIRVLSYVIVAPSATSVRWRDTLEGYHSGMIVFTAGGQGISAPYCPVGHFETVVGAVLWLESSPAVTISGHLTYIEVSA